MFTLHIEVHLPASENQKVKGRCSCKQAHINTAQPTRVWQLDFNGANRDPLISYCVQNVTHIKRDSSPRHLIRRSEACGWKQIYRRRYFIFLTGYGVCLTVAYLPEVKENTVFWREGGSRCREDRGLGGSPDESSEWVQTCPDSSALFYLGREYTVLCVHTHKHTDTNTHTYG